MAFIKFIFVLFVVLYWALFCIYNTGTISAYLPGSREINIPISLFVFIVFLLGVFITAFLALTDQIHQWSLVKKLKSRIKKLEKDSPQDMEMDHVTPDKTEDGQ